MSAGRRASPQGSGRDERYAKREGEQSAPVIGLRRKIAEKMQEAKRNIPHFTYVEEVDVTELEALRALTWHAVERYVAGEDMTRLASMAKLKAARLQREINDSCLQYWGGMGFMAETPVSRRFRDGRLASIGGGADEVMLGIIAKHMGTLPGRGN